MRLATTPHSPSGHPVQPTPARACGRNKVRKDRAKAYRDIKKLKGTVASQHRLMEKYKKRYFRLVSTSRKTRDSPSSKADRLLHGISRPEGCVEVMKVLIFHYALNMQLKKKYRNTRQNRLQQQIRRIAMGKVLRKYRMIDRAKLAFAGGVDITPEEGVLDLDRKRRSDALTADQIETVRNFLQRDDSSRLLPGKRDTVTRRKVKMQKRLLSDSMATLHAVSLRAC